MNKIYTLKKEILFKNNIYQILSLDIDKNISIKNNKIEGKFKLKGDYLIRENEQDNFDIEIPYIDYIDEYYDTDKSSIDIDDFYYEIKDSNKLVVNIDLLVDNLIENDIEEIANDNIEIANDNIEITNNNLTIEDTIYTREEELDNYVTYRVYIVRENDTVESISAKYNVSYELLSKYNTINELNIGDKLIIPYERN